MVSGLWIDPVTKVNGAFKKSKPKTFASTVRMLTSKVLKKVNTEYSLEPPLQSADMIVDTLIRNTLPALPSLSFLLNIFITEANGGDDIHGIDGIDNDGLVVLIKPDEPAAKRIKGRFKTLKETEKKASDLIGFIRDEDSDDKGMITTRLHLSC
jgi:hypothetical protein